MKEEYDFSKAECGKFYRPDTKLNVPVYLDTDVRDYLANKAKSKDVEVNEIVNDLLRKDIAMIEDMKWYFSVSTDEIRLAFNLSYGIRCSMKAEQGSIFHVG